MDSLINIQVPQEETVQNINLARRQQKSPQVKNAVPQSATLKAGQNIQILRTVTVGPPLQPVKQLAAIPIQLLLEPKFSASTAMGPLLRGRTPSILRQYSKKTLCVPKDPLAVKEIIEPPQMSLIPKKFTPCFRLVDLDVLAQCLWCDHCQQALSLKNFIRAFDSFLHVKCYKCPSVYKVPLTRATDDTSFQAQAEQCTALSKQLNTFKIQKTIPKISVDVRPPANVSRRIINFVLQFE